MLSNYHVFEADIVPGGNGIVAMTGDPIIQPGLIDVGCVAAGAQTVATLVKKSSLPGSNVDCSIGQVVPGMVDRQGADSRSWNDFENAGRGRDQPKSQEKRAHDWFDGEHGGGPQRNHFCDL